MGKSNIADCQLPIADFVLIEAFGLSRFFNWMRLESLNSDKSAIGNRKSAMIELE
jgi:hypothetical protein